MLSVFNTHTQQGDTRNLLEVMDMLIILITVVVSWVLCLRTNSPKCIYEICAIFCILTTPQKPEKKKKC